MINKKPGHQRRSIRLQDFDYSQPGAYFITICSFQHEPLFGDIYDDEIRLNDTGRVVWDAWKALPERFPHISLDAAVVMPNHFHGIICINEEIPSNNENKGTCNKGSNNVGAIHELPLLVQSSDRRLQRRRMTLPIVVGYFKMNTARRINAMRGTPGQPVWQRNYFEYIIRGLDDLKNIKDYIETNPLKWEQDTLAY